MRGLNGVGTRGNGVRDELKMSLYRGTGVIVIEGKNTGVVGKGGE